MFKRLVLSVLIIVLLVLSIAESEPHDSNDSAYSTYTASNAGVHYGYMDMGVWHSYKANSHLQQGLDSVWDDKTIFGY